MEQALRVASGTLKVAKLDAARAQLRTAISLWFAEGDPISVHALAFASYAVIHDLTKAKGLRDLLFDWRFVKPQYRREWNQRLRQCANFFKHADRDAAAEIELNPQLSEHFIMFAIVGISLSGEPLNTEESAFMFWTSLHRPAFFSQEQHSLLDHEALELKLQSLESAIRSIPRNCFLDAFKVAHKMGAGDLLNFRFV